MTVYTWMVVLLLLAALLSVSFPGDMGESDTPLQHPPWRGLASSDHQGRITVSDTHSIWSDSPL